MKKELIELTDSEIGTIIATMTDCYSNLNEKGKKNTLNILWKFEEIKTRYDDKKDLEKYVEGLSALVNLFRTIK